jgi:hypothetical protein
MGFISSDAQGSIVGAMGIDEGTQPVKKEDTLHDFLIDTVPSAYLMFHATFFSQGRLSRHARIHTES